MPKRRAVSSGSDSEDRGEGTSQGSKRARTDDSGYDTPDLSRDVKPNAAQRKARQDDDEADEDDEDENMEQSDPDEDEEKRFEDENEDQIRAKVLNKSKVQGGIAEMGIIEKLEMHQFMCHKYLTFTFGPQINFIIGHNGSGKSAVLSALTVALGGKATTTGRGNGLKSFIREGQSAAEVTVTIKNQGDEAFKPQEYGASIVITRKFTRDGSSSYRICGKNGKLVSTNRGELSAICDHMNIQVDNPMNILTQDSARQFLSASAPADKYKFFLRGTQLSQLSEEYSTCMENITQMQKILVHKSEALPDLEEALNEATARFQEAQKARQQKRKADTLKKELAWAFVAEKENEMRVQMEECEKQNRRLPKYDDSITSTEAIALQTSQRIEELEEEITGLGTIEHLQAQRAEVLEKLKKGKQEISVAKTDERNINESLTAVKKTVDEFQKRIDEETKKQAANTQGKRDELNRKLEEAVVGLRSGEKDLDDLRDKAIRLGSEQARLASEGQALQEERNQVRAQIDNLNGQIRSCNEQEKNKLAPFGQNMDACLADIERARWVGMKPIGPFGMYVKLKDPRWADILRNQLGSAMSSFAVTNSKDRAQLAQILKRHSNGSAPIVITERDLFDYSKGEPPPEFPTVLRALEISDEFVLRMLINQARIEATMLARTRREADDMLLHYGHAGTAWTNDHFRVQRYPEGGGSSSVIARLPGHDRRLMLFRGEDLGSRRSELEQQLREHDEKHGVLNVKLEQSQRSFNDAKQQAAQVTHQQKIAHRRLAELKTKRDALQDEANEDTPIAIQALHDEIATLEVQRQSFKQQFTDIAIKLRGLDDAQKPLLDQSDHLKKQIDEFHDSVKARRSLIEQQATLRMKAQHDKEHFIARRAVEEKKLQEEQIKLQQLEGEYKAWTEKAQQYCDRYPDPRPSDVVKRDLDGVNNALKEREKKQGASVEEMTIEVNKKKAAFENTKKELKEMMILNKALRKSIRIRLKKWHEFRRHIALRCKIYFGYHLSIRGYYGKVLFDHVQGTLQLKVQTDDQHATQTKEKDPRSLSGGEKSFSTICLLLSLWESIGCPIRCLDEFDVFMDAVNRRVSMKMMIDTANASDRKQYILITPQDMTNVQIGPSVRVHRMSDPERGQGVLAVQ